MKYEVEFARFYKVVIEAETENEALNTATVMDDEIIENGEASEFTTWNVTRKEK